MVADRSEELMKIMMNKLYTTLTGYDDSVKLPRNKFITWFMPGIPFDPKDFEFAHKGFVGDDKTSSQQLYHQAFALSKLFDFVPEIPDLKAGGNQFKNTDDVMQTIFTTTQDTISSIWNDVLKYSRVLDNEISEKEKEKLKKFRDALTVTKEEEDILTEEKRLVTKPGPLTIAYTTKMNEYIEAADEYMNLLIDAQAAGNDPESKRKVAAWALKSKFVRKRMEAAYGAWVSQGYKNEYEKINAYIEQVTQKSMVLYKDDLQNKFKNALLSSPAEATAGDFYYTTVIPGNFALSPAWTKFTFSEGDTKSTYAKDTESWEAGGAGCFFGFHVGGGGKTSTEQIKTTNEHSNFSASFEYTQIPILRPWFEPGFFSMRAWTLDKLWYLNYEDKPVSDGKEIPVGRLVAYPVLALFVRNVRFKSDSFEEEINELKKHAEGGGTVGWGPFAVAMKHAEGKETKDTEIHTEEGGLSIKGMQLVGFINNIIPKAPNPSPDIKPEQFVGGAEDTPPEEDPTTEKKPT